MHRTSLSPDQYCRACSSSGTSITSPEGSVHSPNRAHLAVHRPALLRRRATWPPKFLASSPAVGRWFSRLVFLSTNFGEADSVAARARTAPAQPRRPRMSC
eukprot:6185910-Pleurochrysis_carterae.AAC.1